MAVRFILGRAGTGKTHHCLNAIQEKLRREPVRGPRLILLVPEQAALQAERAILEPDDIPGMHRAEVLSFSRFSFKVLESIGGPARRALSEPARAMVIRHLLARHAEHLRYYRRVGRLGGFINRLGATIAELVQETVTPDDLATIAARDDFGDSIQPAKLHDVALIYRAYLEHLGADRLDPSQHLEIAREHLDTCVWLHGALVWVDGFASLSQQETRTLVALAGLSANVEITVLMDPVLADGSAAAKVDPSVIQLFSKTAQTYADLRRALIEGGLVIEEPLLLKRRVPPRFTHNADLARLEKQLFRTDVSRAAGGIESRSIGSLRETSNGVEPSQLEGLARAEARGSGSGDAAQAEACGSEGVGSSTVELVELPTRRLEVEYAVSRIIEWIQHPLHPGAAGLRYKDLAIIVRDLAPYHDLLSEALAACDIPFFIDRRRSLTHHPLVELLRAGVALAVKPLATEPLRWLLKTGLLPITDNAADELENYLLAQGISGADAWRGDWTVATAAVAQRDQEPTERERKRLHRVNETRRTLLGLVEEWLTFCKDSENHTGLEWAQAIAGWLRRMEVDAVFEGWTETAEADGDLDAATEHRQVWRDTMAFLDDLAFAFADVRLSVEELADVVESGLAGMTLGLAPPMVDQVLVGSIERSRHPNIKAAVVMGFNEGVFPARIEEDSVLNDDDRELLRNADVGVASPSRRAILDESLLVYITLTRASEALVVTYSAADEQGEPMRVSRCAQALRQACPGLGTPLVSDPVRCRETWDILSHRDLMKRIVMEFRCRPAVDQDDARVRGRWNELYDSVRATLVDSGPSRWALASLGRQPTAKLAPASVSRLTGDTLTASVSLLETYAACPFQYFAKYGLRLRERERATLDPVDIGHVHHAILEDFVQRLAARRRGFAQLGDAELIEDVQESCRRVTEQLPDTGAVSDARNAYLLRRSNAYLTRVLRAQQRIARAGSARPAATEVPFGFDRPSSLPALELTTPSGRHVRLRGYIDRVDLAELGDELLGIVVDYKRTRDKHLSLTEVYHGLSLQLPGYLLALAMHGKSLTGRPVRPIAALYVSLAERYHNVGHPDLLKERDGNLHGTYQPRGLLLADALNVLDDTTQPGRSDHFSVYRKTDGSMGNLDTTDVADGASFKAVLDHTLAKLGELADGILDGTVAVRPYRLGTFSPCSWCALAEACRVEAGLCDVRFLEKLKRSEVFRRLSEKRSEP